MVNSAEKTIQWSGSAPAAISWQTLVDIFEALFGASLHDLPEWPKVIGHTTVRWTDGSGTTYRLDRLDELREPYEQGEPARSSSSLSPLVNEELFFILQGTHVPAHVYF
jgi:hypothetical protein